MRVFVTVGSTRFDPLIDAVLSPPILESLQRKGYTRVIVQCGNYSAFNPGCSDDNWVLERDGVQVEVWKYKPSLQSEFRLADLIISHAGSGTILEVLRLKKPLIVVPNPTLADNHQDELASSLDALGYLRSSSVTDLARTIKDFDGHQLQTFPDCNSQKFGVLLDEEMGF